MQMAHSCPHYENFYFLSAEISCHFYHSYVLGGDIPIWVGEKWCVLTSCYPPRQASGHARMLDCSVKAPEHLVPRTSKSALMDQNSGHVVRCFSILQPSASCSTGIRKIFPLLMKFLYLAALEKAVLILLSFHYVGFSQTPT